MRGIPRWLLAPIMRVWVSLREMELASIPSPTDPAEATAGGDTSDVDREDILVLGGCISLGWGVVTNDLALPGTLARARAASTGRSAHVRVVAEYRLGPRAILARLDTLEIEQYSTVVLTMGMYRALRLASLRMWERDLGCLLEAIDARMHPDARLVVTGVHPIRAIPIFNTALGGFADAHGRAMNKVTKVACVRLSRALYVELTARESRDLGRIRTAADYRHYGELLAARMAAPHESRPAARHLAQP